MFKIPYRLTWNVAYPAFGLWIFKLHVIIDGYQDKSDTSFRYVHVLSLGTCAYDAHDKTHALLIHCSAQKTQEFWRLKSSSSKQLEEKPLIPLFCQIKCPVIWIFWNEYMIFKIRLIKWVWLRVCGTNDSCGQRVKQKERVKGFHAQQPKLRVEKKVLKDLL